MRILQVKPVSALAFFFLALASPISAEESRPPAASLTPGDIQGFDAYPAGVQELLRSALALSELKLGYTYGSADPKQGGMDCSGAMYFLLQQAGLPSVPRSSSEQYAWVRKAGTFRAVLSTQADSFELNELAPGDLLFWSGTYDVKRDPPVTHSMIYLGKTKDGLPVMFGSSDGRTYRGKKQWGVGVFDFKIPQPSEKNPARFVGYATIPGLKTP